MQLFDFWPLPFFFETRSSNACNMSSSDAYTIFKIKICIFDMNHICCGVLNTCIYTKQGNNSNIKATHTSSGSDFCFDATWKSDSRYRFSLFLDLPCSESSKIHEEPVTNYKSTHISMFQICK